MTGMELIFLGLFLASEALAQIPRVKANSVFQAVKAVLAYLMLKKKP